MPQETETEPPAEHRETVSILSDLLSPDREEETHISHVFLCGDQVYKIKKPADFGFLDYSTLELRHRYCHHEIDLNRRFAPHIYRDVLKLVQEGDSWELVDEDDPRPAREYVVHMKRVDKSQFLSTRLDRGEIEESHLEDLGRTTASTWRDLALSDDAEKWGGYDQVRANVEENFDQTSDFPTDLLPKRHFEIMKAGALHFLDDHRDLFTRRVEQGYVKDGHGDVRLEHVFYDNGGTYWMDCIEFNQQFRYNDAVSEAAFLAVELDQLDRIDLSDAFARAFLGEYGDDDSALLWNFYKSYRAYVRAKVTGFLLAEKDKSWPEYQTKFDEGHHLFDLALVYTLNFGSSKTLVFYGPVASGKSTLAKAWTGHFPTCAENTDHLRKVRAGLDPEDNRAAGYEQGLYSKENTESLYRELGALAREKQVSQRLCLIDGSFSKPEYWKFFDCQGDLDLVKIMCTAPEEEILHRLEKRSREASVSDGGKDIYYKQKESAEFAAADITIDTTEPTEDSVERIVNHLARREGL